MIDKKSEELFLRILKRYQKPILNYLWRYLGSMYDAQECAQESFIKLYRNIEKINSDESCVAYLYKTATNIARNIQRRKKISHIVSFAFLRKEEAEHPDYLIESISDTNDKDPAVSYEEKRKHKIIQRAIDKLPHYQRAAVLLFYHDGKSYQEIAATLGKSIPSVESLLSRAKENLSRHLGELLEK